MGKRAARARLVLHRETVRTLSGRELAAVAGGDWLATVDVTGLDTVYCDPETCPKTNAWTAGEVMDALCHA